MFAGSPSILDNETLLPKKEYRAFVCQNRPTNRKRVYFDNHTVPKFAWYGQMSDGTRFIMVKNGSKVGMISHREMTMWSQDFIPAVYKFVVETDCEKPHDVTQQKFHATMGPVIRKGKHKSRLPSKRIENYSPHTKLSSDYKKRSESIYGTTININNKSYDIGTSRMATYMDGSGMGPNFDNSDRRPLEPQFPVKSGKKK